MKCRFTLFQNKYIWVLLKKHFNLEARLKYMHIKYAFLTDILSFFPKTFVNDVIDFLGKASNNNNKKQWRGGELLKGGILGSRSPDSSSGKSGHFCKKHKNRQIISYILKKNVPKPPLSSKIGHNRAYIFCMVHDMCIKLVLIL